MVRKGIPLRGAPGGFPRRALALAALAAAWAAVSCIERSNPFDPINAGDGPVTEVRKRLQARLDSLGAGEGEFGPKLGVFDSVFRSDSSANAAVVGANAGRRGQNVSTSDANADVKAANAGAPVDSLKPLQAFLVLNPLKGYGPYPEFQDAQSALRDQAANLALFMTKTNASHGPAAIYPPDFSDSVLAPFERDKAAYAGLQARIDDGNRAVSEYNLALKNDNTQWAEANRLVSAYNDSINYLKATGNKPVIASADSLLAGTKGARAGDTLLIGVGVFTADLRFDHSGTPENPILVRGFPGGKTVLQAPAGTMSVMSLSANSNIRFQDIVFQGGVKLENSSRNVSFHSCVFTGSAKYGLDVADSYVELMDCRITENAFGASFTFKGDSNQADIKLNNVLIARNAGSGLYLNNPKGQMRNCTISDNGGVGIELIVSKAEFAIRNCIISGNGGLGLYRHRETEMPGNPVIELCDVSGNVDGDWSLGGLTAAQADAMKAPNFSIPPVFVSPDRLEYALQPGSALAELEHQSVPVFVGYRP